MTPEYPRFRIVYSSDWPYRRRHYHCPGSGLWRRACKYIFSSPVEVIENLVEFYKLLLYNFCFNPLFFPPIVGIIHPCLQSCGPRAVLQLVSCVKVTNMYQVRSTPRAGLELFANVSQLSANNASLISILASRVFSGCSLQLNIY